MEKLIYAFIAVLVGLYIYGFINGSAISPLEIIFFLITSALFVRFLMKKNKINKD